jgi:hypothetical protein
MTCSRWRRCPRARASSLTRSRALRRRHRPSATGNPSTVTSNRSKSRTATIVTPRVATSPGPVIAALIMASSSRRQGRRQTPHGLFGAGAHQPRRLVPRTGFEPVISALRGRIEACQSVSDGAAGWSFELERGPEEAGHDGPCRVVSATWATNGQHRQPCPRWLDGRVTAAGCEPCRRGEPLRGPPGGCRAGPRAGVSWAQGPSVGPPTVRAPNGRRGSSDRHVGPGSLRSGAVRTSGSVQAGAPPRPGGR